jgi:glutaredoxin
VLQRSGVAFVEIDIEKTPSAEEAMRALNGGSGRVPTILIKNDSACAVLIEPGDRELTDALRSAQKAGTN